MTKEDKELLLKDICGRLPYRPIVRVKWNYYDNTDNITKSKETDRELEINDFYEIWNVKPYLRPMSSMTDEELREYQSLCDGHVFEDRYGNYDTIYYDTWTSIDYLLSHHFDCRGFGLIEKGLALEAPEGMYNFLSK